MRLAHNWQLWQEVIGLGHSCLLLAVQLMEGSQGVGLVVLPCKPGSMLSATVVNSAVQVQVFCQAGAGSRDTSC